MNNPRLGDMNGEILELMVGRYGFAVRVATIERGERCPPGTRSAWYLLRPNGQFSNGPYGTRQMARRCLERPNWEGERQWGAEAAEAL